MSVGLNIAIPPFDEDMSKSENFAFLLNSQ